MSFLAIDIGSSACKAVVFTRDGTRLAEHTCGYSPELSEGGCAEMNPDTFWSALRECCQAVSRNLPEPVRALCLSSHGETFVPCDPHGRPLMNAILNQDSRATHEAASIERLIGRKRLFEITGQRAHPMYPLPKILWLRKHRPEIFSATHTFVSLIGYLLARMGLTAYIDHSLASRYLTLDVRTRTWSEEILQSVGLNADCLPTPLPAGTVVGELSASVATQLGLRAGTAVVLGGHDQPCSALGCGVIGPGRVTHSIGTYECLVAASATPSLNERAFAAALNTYCHVIPDKYVTLAYFPSGIMVRWFHDLLYPQTPGNKPDTEDTEEAHYAFLEAHAPAHPSGLCVTPHLIGTCNPEFNPHARALMVGLGPGTDRSHIHKGILEGVACELALLTDELAKAAGDFQDLYVTGGGVRSMLGLKLRAALTGCNLHIMQQQQAACLGAALLAGLAVGEYRNVEQAISDTVRESAVVTPDRQLAAQYATQAKRYRQLRSLAVQLD